MTRNVNIEGVLRPKNKLAITTINVKNFHGSLTTVVRAQNDNSKIANITFSNLDTPRRMLYLTSEDMLPSCVMKLSQVFVSMCCARLVCNNASQHTEYSRNTVGLHCTVSNCKRHPTAFAKMLVYSALYNVNERRTFA